MPMLSLAVLRIARSVDPTDVWCSMLSILHARNILNARTRRRRRCKGRSFEQRRSDMDLGLQDKVAIVMAASKGLGRACATALAAEGARVTIGARSAQALEKTAQEIRQATGSRVLAVPTDVTRAQDVEAIVAATVREFGRIDILVNNAGGPPAGNFESFSDAQW